MNNKTTDTGTRWKIILASLVALFIGAQVLTMALAGRKVARVVDRDYYKNGQSYGDDLRRSKADRPDWTMTADIRADQVQVTLRNRSGAAVTGGSARLEFSGPPVSAMQLLEAAPGVYRGSQTFSGSELHGMFRISRGDAVYAEKLVLFR